MADPARLLSRLLAAIAGSWAFNARWRAVNADLITGAREQGARGLVYTPPPPAYGCAAAAAPTAAGPPAAAPLFVSARFRSGSTLLWNLFRHTPGITAYYEPLNERRWFLPRRPGERTDPTHVHVADYWREYAGMADLDRWFRDDWTTRNLYLDAHGCDRALGHYLDALITRAPGRAVLQCNRLDFRLAWVRARFPGAGVLVLYRHPREQWLSVVRGQGRPADHRIDQPAFADHFYTRPWAEDLRRVFPLLDPAQHEHWYAVHYLLWRLSLLAAERDADLLLAYEDLIRDCAGNMTRVLARFGIPVSDETLATYQTLLEPPRPPRWPGYADAAWFAAIEGDCEAELQRFLLAPPATGAG